MRKLSFAIPILMLFATSAFAAKQEATAMAPDGFALKGTLYSAARTGSRVLMLHQCNADRRIYDNLAQMLSIAGYHVLTFDFRGFGESKGQAIIEKMPADVDAAYKFLSSQENVNPTKIAIIGGSCGVHQAIQAARRQAETAKGLVLLSGGTDAAGEEYIKNSKIAVLE